MTAELASDFLHLVTMQAFFKKYDYKHEVLVQAADGPAGVVFSFVADSVSCLFLCLPLPIVSAHLYTCMHACTHAMCMCMCMCMYVHAFYILLLQDIHISSASCRLYCVMYVHNTSSSLACFALWLYHLLCKPKLLQVDQSQEAMPVSC